MYDLRLCLLFAWMIVALATIALNAMLDIGVGRVAIGVFFVVLLLRFGRLPGVE
jgi:hypothetical protein